MQALLNRDDMRTVRTFLRWVSIGAQPSAQLAASVSEVIKPLPPEAVSLVQPVIDQARRGVLASQKMCSDAQKQLQTVCENPQDIETSKGEVPRG